MDRIKRDSNQIMMTLPIWKSEMFIQVKELEAVSEKIRIILSNPIGVLALMHNWAQRVLVPLEVQHTKKLRLKTKRKLLGSFTQAYLQVQT